MRRIPAPKMSAQAPATAPEDAPSALPRVTITIAQRLAFQPRPHMVGKETTKRVAQVLYETTDRLGQRRTRTEKRLYSGTPIQAETTATAHALSALKVPCQVRVITGNRVLVERPESALKFNSECWRILARAEARHHVSYELLTPAKDRADLPDLD